MNVTNQKCNSCSVQNVAEDKTWTRVFGAYSGAPNLQPAQPQFPFNRPNSNPAPNPNFVSPVTLDLCPACAEKATMAQLVELTKPAAPISASQPAHVAAPVAAAK